MSLADDFRQKSQSALDVSNTILQGELFQKEENQVLKQAVFAIIGQLKGITLSALADMIDNDPLSALADKDVKMDRRLEILKKHATINNAIRIAASKGNWDEFDRIVAEQLDDADDGPATSSGP